MMRIKYYAIAVLVFVCCVLAGAQQKKVPAAAGGDEATLKQIEEKWAAAFKSNDASAIESSLADDIVYTSSSGSVEGKAEVLKDIKSGKVKWDSAAVSDMRVHLHGDAAVITGRFQGKGSEDGKPVNVNERWTDTFVKMNGRWMCVASQSTEVKAPPAAKKSPPAAKKQ